MNRNALRKELTTLLPAPAESRPPVIRRSLKEAWLYATDLPAMYGGGVPDTIQKALSRSGWEYLAEDGWLQLRKDAAEPPEAWYDGPFGPEAGCCLSLLKRHPAPESEPSDAAQRMLIKAGEEGEKAYEDTCVFLHREWADRLRQGKALPAISRKYFGG